MSRQTLGQQVLRGIEQPGGLTRLKGVKHVGKTLLQHQVLEELTARGYDCLSLSFKSADRQVFEKLEIFLKWFCAVVSRELGLDNQVNDCWDEFLSQNYNATNYFESYILKNREIPFVLALDDTDLVFEHEAIAIDFCQLLRGWHEQAMRSTRMGERWKMMRLLIIHSTEMYAALDINASPLANVGTVVQIEEFNTEQIEELAQQNRVELNVWQTQKLMALISGHPALAQVTFDHMLQGKSLEDILIEAHTESSVYASYLREQLEILRHTPALAADFKLILESQEPIQVNTDASFKLQSMGLILLTGDLSTPRNELYRRYFRGRL